MTNTTPSIGPGLRAPVFHQEHRASRRCFVLFFGLLALSAGSTQANEIYMSAIVRSGQESDSVYYYANPIPGSISAAKGRSTAFCQVHYGTIGLLANLTSAASSASVSNQDFAQTRGDFTDELKIEHPARTGQKGFITVAYQLDGTLLAQGPADPNDPGKPTRAKYLSTVAVGNATGVDNASYELNSHTYPNAGTDILGQRRQLVGEFTFGQQFQVSWSLRAESYVPAFTSNTARADIRGRFIGVVKVTDADGNEIKNYALTSQSGTEYGPRALWAAGRDLAANEKPDRPSETNAVNETVPQWSYGYRTTAAGTNLTLFPADKHVNSTGLNGVEGFGDSEINILANTRSDSVTANFGFGPLKPLLPGQIFTHPHTSKFTVARWTAPANGRYNIVARWLDLDNHGGNGFSAHVVIKGVMVFNQEIANDGGIDVPLQNVDLNAGEFVDFVVGSRGDFTFDSTGFNAAISIAPAVGLSVPGAQNGKLTAAEGQDVSVTANILLGHPTQTVELRDNGKVVARDNAAPYEFTIENIESGFHRLIAVAVDSRGVEGVSEIIDITVTKAQPSPQKAATDAAHNATTPQATNGRSYFFAKEGGYWSDPTNWTPQGVPGPGDDAFIFFENATVVLDQDVTVGTVTLGGGVEIFGPSGSTPTTLRVERGFFNDGNLADFNLVIDRGAEFTSVTTGVFPPPQLNNMLVINNGVILVSRPEGLAGAGNTSLQNNGTATLQRVPASNRTTKLLVPQVQHNGGLMSIGSGSKLVTGSYVANAPTKLISEGAGTILSDAAGGLIGDAGSGLIGSDGATLKGPNGAPLIGSDGATLVGNAGNTIAPSAPAGQTQATANGVVLKPGAVITGRGNIVGDVTNEAGFISPGSPTDAIRILGNYTQQAQGTLVLEVGGTSPNPPQFDQLQIRGTATLGGKLVVNSIGNFTPAAGDSFTPLTYNSASGNFASITSNAQVTVGSTGVTMKVSGPNPPAPKALNIATRMKVETGDNALIAGFIITGSQSKKVIIRGIGPSLPFGGVLADPTLSLDGGAVVNNNWRTDQEQEIIATTIPPSHNLEAAIVATLAPGPHTAVLRGNGGATGIGIVEVYDLDSGAPVQLANISSRGFVQTGDDVMIGGFIIGGTHPAKVLVRAIGPSLTAFGIQGALADPTLELYDPNGGVISNDNWRSTQEAEVTATTIPPTNDLEPAIVAALPPGNYTAVVRGKNNTTGIAVVEAYNLQ